MRGEVLTEAQRHGEVVFLGGWGGRMENRENRGEMDLVELVDGG